MKIQIREGVFETNSSSTHSLALFNGSDWQAFKEGKMVIETASPNGQFSARCFHAQISAKG